MPHYHVKVQPSSNEVTQAEFSRIIGVKPPTVGEFKRDGRLVIVHSGGRDKVKVNESIERLNATMKLHGVFRNRQTKQVREEEEKPMEELKTEVNAKQLDLETQDAELLFKNSRALKEKALAMQAKLEYEVAMGNLVLRNDVHKAAFEASRKLRDSLHSFCKQSAPDLVGMGKTSQIEDYLRGQVDKLLEEFINTCQ